MLTIILFSIFAIVAFLAYTIIPALYKKTAVMSQTRQQRMASNMEALMSRDEARKKGQLLVFSPIIFSTVLFFLFPEQIRILGVLSGFIIGIVFPGMYIKTLSQQTREKFNDQLIDALMIMSSSFRGGLSLVQALEAVVDEMPNPINREFAIVLGENKMGVSLEEALYHLYNRQPSAAVQQMITAILLARETGGNLPVIFTRIVNNIRETKKIQQSLDTLTLQGKIQGGVMSLLPIGFGFIVYSANRRIFIHMLESHMGKTLLVIALVLEVVGIFFIWKVSTFKDY